MEISGELHIAVALPQGNEPPMITEQKSRWVSKTFWTLRTGVKLFPFLVVESLFHWSSELPLYWQSYPGCAMQFMTIRNATEILAQEMQLKYNVSEQASVLAHEV
jgi:hypothetical protein